VVRVFLSFDLTKTPIWAIDSWSNRSEAVPASRLHRI